MHYSELSVLSILKRPYIKGEFCPINIDKRKNQTKENDKIKIKKEIEGSFNFEKRRNTNFFQKSKSQKISPMS